MYILGISAYYHDSAVCLVKDGEILFAAQEERYSRKKHDSSFPTLATKDCFLQCGISSKDINYVAFYEKPFIKFERILETYLAYAPKGMRSFLKSMPLWIKKKLWIKELLRQNLNYQERIIFPEHHMSHAGSAFFPSPFQEAAFITMDGVGEWATTSYGIGKNNEIKIIADLHFPHSLGLLYSAFTYYTGFKVNSGEYKVMGLAPYGEPKYRKTILENLIDIKEDGSFRMNMVYFNYCTGLTMTSGKFNDLFGGPPRKPESSITQKEMDLARSVQEVTEEIVVKIAKHVKKETGMKYLCLAGGVALNCVANGKLMKEKIFDDIWIQPASGDAGGALGTALFTWHQYLENNRETNNINDSMKGSYLGCEFKNDYVEDYLKQNQYIYSKITDEELFEKTSEFLAEGKVVGWFQGRMEFGPRALGARSILGDARSPEMQKIMNIKIKYRESFRPFAPSVLKEKLSEYFEISTDSPYMLLVAKVKKEKQFQMTQEQNKYFGIDKLNVIRSEIPAVTHIDYSARIQSVDKISNPKYYKMINKFYEKYKCPVIANTSFNVRGEPIVCTPEDAYICFMRTEMDYLIIGNFLLDKNDQAPLETDIDWRNKFELD